MHKNLYLSLPVLLGGALGAICRVCSDSAIMAAMGGHFPLGILCVNMAGSFVMGLLMGLLARMGAESSFAPWLNAFVGTGFLGGFTTFSTFSKEALMMLQAENYWTFVAYVSISVVVGIILTALGYAMSRLV